MQLEEITNAKIIQIMPAPPGWEAVWGDSYEPTKGEAGFRTELVACWALVEVNNRRLVTSMLPDLESGELRMLVENEYFLGYRYPSETSTNWTQRATERRTTVDQQLSKTDPTPHT
ncbi:MAG: hypothetical protein H0U76_31090 [Ktedonobacteraceae bacterium]|nr:hypothetical protein [Ktedonobacteraceae bacterium]